MMTSMAAKKSFNSCSCQLSSLSFQEKGSRNKRNFRTDRPVSDPSKVLTSVLNDGTSSDMCGYPPGPCDMCGSCDHSDALKLGLGLLIVGMCDSSEVGPSQGREEVEDDEFQDANWNDLTESQLEELVIINLKTNFESAIKQIVACGYPEEEATIAVSRSGQCFGPKDTVSNIVDNALGFLVNKRDNNPLGELYIQDFQQLGKYVLAELVGVLRVVRPFFSYGDALWCLLLSDLNISHVCAMDGNPLSTLSDGSSNVSTSNPPQSLSKVEPKSSEKSLPCPCKPVSKAPCTPGTQSEVDTVVCLPNIVKQKGSIILNAPTSSSCKPLEKPFSAVMPQTSAGEEKFVSSKKIHSAGSKREYTLRQKSLHMEKTCRAHRTKGTFRTAKFSGYILDKRGKPLTDSASLSLKSTSLKISKAVAMGLELAHENGSFSFSTNSSASSGSATFTLEGRGTISLAHKSSHSPTIPVAKVKSTLSAADSELSLSLQTKSNSHQVNSIANSEPLKPRSFGIPYDKSLAQWVPQDKKDEVILKLVPGIRELQNQLQEWTEWANQKVMQAARRLGKDKAELKTLRQEKEEVKRLKKEKQTLKENTMKKLSDMENALGEASGQVERANASVRKLEGENATLRHEMEAAKLQAAESAARYQEVSKHEKMTKMEFQSSESQKCFFQEELVAERQKLSHLQQEVEQAKGLQSQLEARWKREEKAKHELLTQANSIRKEREQLEASAKSKEDTIRLKAEANLQKYKEDIQKLKNEIKLRLKSDSSKISASKIDGNYITRVKDSETSPASKELQDCDTAASGFQAFSRTGGVKRERECVMCLSEETSVVFLPCAHQVVCKMCNELHEKQGMNDCPSCRSPILRRICVRYAPP